MNVTSSVRALPARVVPLPGESLVSLVRRTAAAMGYAGPHRLRPLLADAGKLPANVNPLGPGPLLDLLAVLLRQPSEMLLGLSVHRFAPTLVFRDQESPPATVCDFKTTLKYFVWGAFPICPACLKQDPTPYERLAWSLRALPVCLEHRCWLVARCPACRRALRPERSAVSVCRCGKSLGDVEPLALGAGAIRLAETLEALLIQGVTCLPEMSAAALCWWTERLATAAAKTPTWINRVGERLGLETDAPADSIAWLTAAEMIGQWPHHFDEFLDAFQQVPKHHNSSTGVALRFGLLLREAARLEDLGYPTPAEALRQYLLMRYAGGHLSRKVCLFQRPQDRQLLHDRTWITQTEAATVLKVRKGAIPQLIQQGILTGQVQPAGNHGRSVGLVLRASVDNLRCDLQSAAGVSTAASRLGLGKKAIHALIHDGVLIRVVRTNNGWRIPLSSLSTLEGLCHSAAASEASGSPWVSLREATRIFGPAGLTLSRLLAMIQAGKVTPRLAHPEQRLHGLVVDQHAVIAALPELRVQRDQVRGCPVHRLGKTLFLGRPVKVDVLKKWIDAGLLQTQQIGRARIVSPAEVHRFRETYCLREEALRILGIAGTTLRCWQTAGRILPVYPKRVTPHVGLYLYRRADLEPLRSVRRKHAAA
jgi:hypothetical protein